jgi:hypothetical protein
MTPREITQADGQHINDRARIRLHEWEREQEIDAVKQARLQQLRAAIFTIRPDASLSLRPWRLEEGWPLGGPVESE